MKNICQNCNHFCDEGYKENKFTQNIGFCNRFVNTTNKLESCVAFISSTKIQDFYRNQKKALSKKLKLPNCQKVNDDIFNLSTDEFFKKYKKDYSLKQLDLFQ